MKRRTFIASIGAGCLTAIPVFAQSREAPRVGYLIPTRRDASAGLITLFADSMRRRGYVEGKTMTIDLRAAEDDVDRLPSLAAQLVQARVDLVMSRVPEENGYGAVLAALASDRVDALVVPTSPRFAMDYRQLIAAAAANGIPTMYEWGYMARAGGLIAYGPDGVALEDRAADYVARILKGAKPADMPVEQPAKFELVVNQKTAEALHLTIPQSLLLRADEVVQ
jgi:ABC-type uncharacterized transport system substrate-binding protein